uniref:Uncharacterized protein n=1 Tax=Ditylenchus dipsaci TaxID=166011 RepID=A0A915ECP3_9BILA
MREEDLRVVASLVDWSNSDKVLNKVFYEKYGKILEEKLTNFQECKAQMKDCIKNNYGDSMVPRTPKLFASMMMMWRIVLLEASTL